MRLCVNCIHYNDDNGIAKCDEDHWIVNDSTKSKIYNPMMFECFDYESCQKSKNFSNDPILDVFTMILR